MSRVNVAVIGFGTIGAGVVKILLKKRSLLKKRAGIDVCLKYVCDLDITSDRGIGKVPEQILTTDWKKVISDDQIDIVVELVGGIRAAKEIVLSSLKAGKIVVTANKALLSEVADEIFSCGKIGENIFFEASVCGAIPVIKTIHQALVANRISGLYGIVNGTCNYILTQMYNDRKEFKEILSDAQRKGYAEKDPTLDIEGIDSAHKLSLLAMLSFGKYVHPKRIPTEGISKIQLIDLLYADEMGYKVKLLAVAEDNKSGMDIRVHPALLPKDHLLSNVSGVFNALYVKCDEAGDIMLYGRGAGRFPTASAVVSDIIDASIVKIRGVEQRCVDVIKCDTIAESMMRYYVRFSVVDKPGVLAKISGVFGKMDISIASVQQTERAKGKSNVVPLILITHESTEKKMKRALDEIARLDVCKGYPVMMRIVDL